MLGGALARTVSDAGAFGMLGFGEGETAESLAEQLAMLRGGNAPVRFGIGLVRWALDLAIAAKPAFVSISFGDPTPYVERFHDAGILVGAQVQSRAWARTALAAGVDILTAQGTEAGGHTGSVGTLPLLQIVLEMAGDVPVIAAGGMATGRGLAAVLAAGASGAWIGTPFLVAREARSNDVARERIMPSDETQTVLTRAFERVSQKVWPTEFPGRALRNAFTDRYAGQTVGLVDAVVIVARIVAEAQTRLPAAPRIACGADELAIDELTARFFTTFTNRGGVIPDFDRFDELFIPEATLIKNVGGTPVVYDVASFLEPRKTILTDGTVREFSEYETSAQTHAYGNIAQRLSRYEKSWIASGVRVEGRGAKVTQFVRTPQGWKISSVAWDDDP